MIDDPSGENLSVLMAHWIQQAIQFHSKGNLGEAEKIYREILARDPEHYEALHYLGVVAYQVGQLAESEKLINRSLAQKPDYAEAHCNLGLVLNRRGQENEAITCFDKAIGLSPEHAPAHFNRANSLQHLNRIEEAIAGYQEAVSLKGDYAEAHYNLGLLFEKKGEKNLALESYQHAVQHRPDFVDAQTNLGGLYFQLSEFEKARSCYQLVLQNVPDSAQAQFNLAQANHRAGHLEDAERGYREALKQNPNLSEAHNNLGVLLKDRGRWQEALSSYQQAISIRPDYDEAYVNLGNASKALNRLDDALSHYQKAVEINPEFADAWFALGVTCQELGFYEKAKSHLQKAISLKPDEQGWQVREALVLPLIYKSCEELTRIRDRLIADIARLRDQKLSIGEPEKSVGTSNFFFAYHNKSDRSLMEHMASLYLGACPELRYQAGHCNKPAPRGEKKYRIGFLSSYFRAHTIGRLNVGLIEKMPRDRFEIFVLHASAKKDQMTRRIDEAADTVVQLKKEVSADRETIAQLELDALFYPEIGMDAYTYFLAFSRLAPVQAVTWGHPDTTGLPEMDYFISSRLLEEENAQADYSEELVELSVLPTCYERPDRPKRGLSRSDFKLPSTGTLYLCPQTLFKFHPEFDDVLRQLLERDPEGYLVLIEDGKGGHWQRALEDRWSKGGQSCFKRALFVEQLEHAKYLELLGLADVVLDIPAFSGGNSSLEAFAMGAPVVTWPGRLMRSRVTAGYYRQMGVTELVVSDCEGYVEAAFRLAHDEVFRKSVIAKIEANSPKVFQCETAVLELAKVFAETIDKTRQKPEA